MIDQDILTFFLVSLSSTLEVSVMVGIGIVLSYVGFVNKTMIKNLSEVTLWVLTPCLLAHKFSTNVTLDLLRTAWPIILFGILYQGIGYLLSRAIFWKRIWGPDRISDRGRSVLNCSVMFNNANSLPFLFVVALCRTGDIFHDEQAASNLAIAYVSVFLLPTRFTFWSYTLYAFKSDTKAKPVEQAAPAQPVTQEKLDTSPIEDVSNDHIEGRSSEHHKLNVHDEVIEMEEDNKSFASDSLINEQKEEEEEIQQPKTFRDRLKEFPWKKMATSIVSPPIVGMMFGLLVGIIPALKNILVTDPPALLSIIDHVASTFGGAMFPVSMMILGTNLYDTFHSSRQQSTQHIQDRPGIHRRITDWMRRNIIKFNHPMAVLFSCLLRLVIMPLIAVGLTVGAMKIGLLPSNDPVILLVLMIEGATPCAMNLAIAVNLNDDPTLANSMCEIMLFQYLLSPITMALLSTWYLHMACNLTGMCLIQ
jgi:predicted permease